MLIFSLLFSIYIELEYQLFRLQVFKISIQSTKFELFYYFNYLILILFYFHNYNQKSWLFQIIYIFIFIQKSLLYKTGIIYLIDLCNMELIYNFLLVIMYNNLLNMHPQILFLQLANPFSSLKFYLRLIYFKIIKIHKLLILVRQFTQIFLVPFELSFFW